MITNRIVLASDHAGYELKEKIKKYLIDKGIEIKDIGARSSDSVDYPEFGHLLAETIENGEYDYGISLCGSANGINMTTNKHQGIRSAICWSEEITRLARLHNDANICSLPARFIDEKQAEKMVNIFLNTEFEGGRHKRRIEKIPCN
jgi:ribose 5-phosphate isomerase B